MEKPNIYEQLWKVWSPNFPKKLPLPYFMELSLKYNESFEKTPIWKLWPKTVGENKWLNPSAPTGENIPVIFTPWGNYLQSCHERIQRVSPILLGQNTISDSLAPPIYNDAGWTTLFTNHESWQPNGARHRVMLRALKIPKALLPSKLVLGLRLWKELRTPETRQQILTVINPIQDLTKVPITWRMDEDSSIRIMQRRLETLAIFFSKPNSIERWRMSILMLSEAETARLIQWAKFIQKIFPVLHEVDDVEHDALFSPMKKNFWCPIWKPNGNL